MSPVILGVMHTLAELQADGAPRNPGPDFGKASPSGLLVVVLLLLAVGFLVRSMNRQLKKVPTSFDVEPDQPSSGSDPGDEHG